MRASLTRFLGVATVVGGLLSAGVLGYGLLEGPPAPIRRVEDGYRDKLGNSYTAEEYALFRAWERALFSAFAATFIAGFGWVAVGRKQRRPGELSAQEREQLASAMDRVERIFPDVAAELRARGPLGESRPQQPHPDGTDPTA